MSTDSNTQVRRAPSRVIVIMAAVSATFMAGMDTTIVNLAIPVLRNGFHADIAVIQWVITAYSLAMAICTPLAAFLANRFGLRRPFVAAVALFTVGSLLCALSPSLGLLVASRVLQGVGGAALLSLSMMVALGAFPPEQRGRAMAWFGIPSMIAPALGPVVAGYLMTVGSWRLVFLINLPVGIAGIALALIALRRPATGVAEKTRFDLLGFVLVGLGSAGVSYGVSESASSHPDSAMFVSLLVAGGVSLLLFVVSTFVRLGRRGDALVDLRLFRYRSFWAGAVALIVIVFAMFGPLFLVPVYLQSVRRLDVLHTGFIMTFNAVAAMIGAFIGGRVVDRFGGRPVVIPGLAIFALDTVLFSMLTTTTPFAVVAALLFLRGIGTGLTTQPLLAASLRDVPNGPSLAHVSTLTSMLRNLVGGTGVAAIASFVQVRAHAAAAHMDAASALTHAIDSGFTLCFIVLLIALAIVIAVLPGRRAEPKRQIRAA
jgi:EmrB/QacA subfamily drug resistance transporter